MTAFAEIQLKLGQHKGKIASGSLLLLVGACGIYSLFNSGQQNPPITEIAPTIAPTDDFGSGGGGDIEDSVETQNKVGCWDAYGIRYYPVGAVTKYTHSKCLGNSLWEVPSNNRIILYQAPQLPPPADQ